MNLNAIKCLGASVLLASAGAASAVTISFGGCAAGDGSVLTTCNASATVVNFNSTPLGGLPAGYVGSLGGGQVVQGSVSGAYAAPAGDTKELTLREVGEAKKGTSPKEVVIALAPAFGDKLKKRTITGIPHAAVLRELMAGIEEEGMTARVIRVSHTSDVAFAGKRGAELSGRLVDQDNLGPAVGKEVADALGGVRRIDRDVSGTGLKDAK